MNTDTAPADTAEPLSIGEAARALGVSVATLRRWEANGQISARRTPTGHRRFPREEVDRVAAGRPSTPTT